MTAQHLWGQFIQIRWLDQRGRLYDTSWYRPRSLAIDGHAYRRRTRRRRP